ncbi:hypothetical protein ACIGPN_05955 [Streptomyces afghaniensis]|uniref:hypothetical protein n=1 Tax=Streptomyces afghaniensis TaxID=66865 RepID=UPI0037CE1A0B
MPDENGAWVPAGEMLSELRALHELVVRLDERLKSDTTAEAVGELEQRVSGLEQRVWRASGVAATLGGLVGVAVPFLTK